MVYPQKLSEEQILEEAAGVVDEAGLDAVSMRVLAKRLGAVAPSLYRYFPDKDTLVRALSAKFWDDLAQAVDRHESVSKHAGAQDVCLYWSHYLRPHRAADQIETQPILSPL